MKHVHSQAALLALIIKSGPLTVQQLALLAYGSDTLRERRVMAARVDNARRAKLVVFDGFGERISSAGKFPAKWKAA